MTTLILVPTQPEMDTLRPLMTSSINGDDCSFQLCGFGPIAAAARTAALLSRYQPDRAILIGIAGNYNDRLQVGSAYRFDSTACYGVGIGSGPDFQSAGELGWHQFNGDETEPRVGDTLMLDSAYVERIPSAGLLVTCCAASACRQDAQRRLSRYPAAVAEDMEGFAVALACSLAHVPVQLVRGISNRVGDRDQQNWQIDQALTAAADLARQLLPESWMPAP